MNTIEKAKWLAEFFRQVADGGEIQLNFEDGGWIPHFKGPNMESSPEYWRVVMPPVLVPVDMSVLVNSGIDCEFWDDVKPNLATWGGLFRVTEIGRRYAKESGTTWGHCKPRMNYWFSRLNFDDVFALMRRLGEAGFVVEEGSVGSRLDEYFAAFRITGTHKDRCWPWENKALTAGDANEGKLGGGE